MYSKKSTFINVNDVTDRRLCLGCGACFYICPEKAIKLIDVEDDGIRPYIQVNRCLSCGKCLQACPGYYTKTPNRNYPNLTSGLCKSRWGGLLEIWEGFAADPKVRYEGSSGGLCTAIAIFCLEQGLAGGVLHVGRDSKQPWKNMTVWSTVRENLIDCAGSRYSPASPCEGLIRSEEADYNSVFIGKPCDIVGLRLAQKIKPRLAKKISLAIGFFCAGTPSTKGTLDLLNIHGIVPIDLISFRYRGQGWPGMAKARFINDCKPQKEISYQDSWGFVQRYRPFRCYLCPDLTAESADISVGDPWYRGTASNDPGRSLILIRSETGREIFRKAIEKGYVIAEAANEEIIYRSQKNLLGKRQAIWGRLLAMRLLGIPQPILEGFHLFDNWKDLSLKEKLKSVIGTAQRIIQRNYFKPMEFECSNGIWQTVKNVRK
jgi:coenzyme F420 hydrogenase subunit beta